MLAIALAAMDALIVGTAMPTIVGTLGGISLYSWLVATYLLTSTVTVPIYGRLADMLGRKPVFLAGITVFLIGSALCGLSASMTQLIIFRAIQGLGAGAVQPMAMTIIGDIFSVEQRAKMQGLFSGVWGVSSMIGPALGGLIVAYASWRWVFYVNIPFGLLALGFIWIVYQERVEHHNRSVDILGSALLMGGVTTLLFALQETGQVGGLRGSALLGIYAASLVTIGVFIWTQTRVAEPTIPLELLRRPIIGIGYLAGLLAGLAQFGVGTYVPLYIQGPIAGTALTVGLTTATTSIGWPVGSILSGRMILRDGYKRVLVVGMVAILLGASSLLFLTPATPVWLIAAFLGVFGLGMGLSSTPIIIAIQNAVPWGQRGVATALNQFFRTIGGVVGVALMGSMLNAEIGGRLASAPELVGIADPRTLLNSLLDPVGRSSLAAPVAAALRGAFAASLHDIFLVVALFAAVGLAAVVFFFPSGGIAEHAGDRTLDASTSDAETLPA